VAGSRWRVAQFDWNDANSEHIERHGVEESEVEEVFRSLIYVRKAHDRYLVLGRTVTGRRLFVVAVKKERGVVRPTTARDMDASERKLYERILR
jgi:hypothetical protein